MWTRSWLVGAATVVVAAIPLLILAGCAPESGTTTSPPSATPSSSASHSTDAAHVRARLAAGLQGSSPVTADLVRDPGTTIDLVDAPWLDGWQILGVQNRTAAHPRRVYVALSHSGEASVLSGRSEAFAEVLRRSGVVVDSTAAAQQVATLMVDVTRTFATYSYRIDDVDDIEWRPTLTAAQRSVRDGLVAAYEDQITAPRATKTSAGWTVDVWAVTGTELERHRVALGPDASLTDHVETQVADLPVPVSR